MLPNIHHKKLVWCLGWRKRKREDHNLSDVHALVKTYSERIEAMVGRRRMLLTGLVARMGEERPPRKMMFGDMGSPLDRRRILKGASRST